MVGPPSKSAKESFSFAIPAIRMHRFIKQQLSAERFGWIMIGLVIASIAARSPATILDIGVVVSPQQWNISTPDNTPDDPERVSFFNLLAGVNATNSFWEFRLFPMSSIACDIPVEGRSLSEHRRLLERPPALFDCV